MNGCWGRIFVSALIALGSCTGAFAAGINTDAVNELTPDAGVTVDGVTAQDGHVALPEVAAPADTSGKLYNEGGALRWNGVRLDQTTGIDAASLSGGTVSNTEFDFLNSVTGPIQTQLDGKAGTSALTTHTGDMSNPHAVTAAQVGLGNANNTSDADKPISTATQTALDAKANATDVATSQAAQDVIIGGKFPKTGTAHVIVETTSNAVTNAANLNAAYTAAKALTPNGAALSATNRAAVLVAPGNYDLGAATFTLDADFVDLVGLSAAREDQRIYSTGHVLTQTAADIRIVNLLLHYTGTLNTVYTYYPNASGVASPVTTTIRNCEFRVNSTSYRSMRTSVEYAGRYEDCLAGGSYSFGDTASGTFTNCTGGNASFGIGGTASGTFTNCIGGNSSFGGTASGTFTNCTGGNSSFGYNTASGTFTNCTGVSGCFGYTASGTFTNCTGGDEAFGGSGGIASGTFTNCIGGMWSFGGLGGTPHGTFIHCTGGDTSFGGGVGYSNGGKFYHCVGGSYSFTETGTPAPVQFFCIQNGAQYPGNN